MSGYESFLNQEFIRGPLFSTCISTTVFTVLFLAFSLGVAATWVIQTYAFSIYPIEIPFVWVSYVQDSILGVWVQTYQRFCTNLLLIYFIVLAIFAALTVGLVFLYLSWVRPRDKDTKSFWAVVLQTNFNVYFRFYWILVYPVQICLVLVLFGVTDVQFLLAALALATLAISLYNMADYRMSKPLKEGGATLCMDFGCCSPEGQKHIPFYTLLEFWIFFLGALAYATLLFVLVLVYTITDAQYHFYYLWAVFVFELIQLVAITVLLTMKNQFLEFFSKQNLALSADVALLFINSVAFLLNTFVLLIVSWAQIGYIGCSNGCATECP